MQSFHYYLCICQLTGFYDIVVMMINYPGSLYNVYAEREIRTIPIMHICSFEFAIYHLENVITTDWPRFAEAANNL